MKDVNNDENDDVQKDIHVLWQQINKLEKAVASLIYHKIYDAIYGRATGGPFGSMNITSERAKKLREDPQKLIDELGGERRFIEIFLSLSEDNSDTE